MTPRWCAPAALLLVLTSSAGMTQMPPTAAPDQAALLQSSDPVLAANKRLVYDMWREIIQGGQVSRVPHYFALDYIQHNPNIASGRDSFARFLAGSRPPRPVAATILFPVISIVAEGDLVVVANARPYPEPGKAGQKYWTTWFDMFRITDGKIAEHWDASLKDPDMVHRDPNSNR